ncbi:MAG: di-trans,poly-cis-decaprenylcistransferase [Methanomicrobiales archaeon]|nr:di-trans,poly-cis-decaprenylcistransferase [Methanomicrobiales archaeon]NYT21201.1 di-trans,poly-cis-decaprenylcistransferase [Methanomicrobiales archaeon]
MIRQLLEPLYEWILEGQIRHTPSHVAIIQDGNRRYASIQGMLRDDGHRLGADRTEDVLEWTRSLGISHVTLYSFSTENFNRDSAEVQALFELFKERFSRVLDDPRIHRNHVRVQMIGDRALLPDDLREVIEQAEKATAGYHDYFLNIAIAYGGRNEIVRAARTILHNVREGKYSVGEISRELVEEHICADHNLPPVDLVIRTGNEYRTSNFLPWLANGHESAVCFCAPYWPIFRRIDFLRALRIYSQRQEGLTGS